MALEFTVKSLDGLDDSVKALYTEKDGAFALDIKGLPQQEDVSGLKAKVDQLLKEKKDASAKTKEAEEAARKAAEEKAKKDGDVEALEKSWQGKWDKREAEYESSTKGLNDSIASLTSGKDASSLAAELAVEGSASALLPHIEGRLSTDIRDGKHATVVLDKEGKPSAATLDEFKKEISETAALAPLIAGSRASGGGAGQGQGGQSSVKESDYFDKKSPHFSQTKQTEIYRDNPERYQQLKDASGQ